MKKSKVSLFFLRFPGTNPRFALRCYAGQRAALLLLFSSEQQHFQCYQSLNKVPARFKPSSLFVLYVCFWRSCALTSRTLSRFFLFFLFLIIVMVSRSEWFTCAELVPYLFPYFSFVFGKQRLSSSSSQRSRARAQPV